MNDDFVFIVLENADAGVSQMQVFRRINENIATSNPVRPFYAHTMEVFSPSEGISTKDRIMFLTKTGLIASAFEYQMKYTELNPDPKLVVSLEDDS